MAKKKIAATTAQVIEHLPTASLKPHAANSRTHDSKQIQSIIKSIREFGFCNPVLVDGNGGIIAGHGRVMAAVVMKLKTVPCLRLTHLTPLQRKAYVIADNKIALGSAWDEDQLATVMQELSKSAFDLEALGFGKEELDELLQENEYAAAHPEEFKEVDEFLATEHRCPKCKYVWSGKSK